MTETEITTIEQLEALVGAPGYRAANKVHDALLPIDRQWLAASPWCVLATADAQG